MVVKSPEDTVLRKLLWYSREADAFDRHWRRRSSKFFG